MTRRLIVLIFLISGMAALTYEVVWVRLLTLTFGTTTYAVSTVLFSFMSGLALGSYLAGRIADPKHFGDEDWHCWDENQDNVDCE